MEERPGCAERAAESEMLAGIGRVLKAQVSELEVRLPPELARRCVEAWEREDLAPLPADESALERAVRHNAGAVALIGLAIAERGKVVDGEVCVALDVGLIGLAIHASDEGA